MPKNPKAKESPLEQALAIISPAEDRREECRKDLQFMIRVIATTAVRPSIVQSRQLEALANAFRDMRRAI
jgi:hypothetical protein